MKKFIPLLIAVLFITSCEDNEIPVTLTASSSITEDVAISIPQTNGTSVAFDETVTQDLTAVISNFNDVTDVAINSLSYEYKNVTGNTDAVLESATIKINGSTIASISFVNMAQEANNGTVFSITDETVLSEIESLFLNNASLDIQFAGTAVSNEGSVSFDIEFSVNLTVTLN